MKHILSILCICIALVTVTAQESTLTTYRLNVENFDELTIVDGVNVDYRINPDSIGYAVFTCEASMASNISFSNKNNHLTIRTNADEYDIPNVPLITVYSTALHKVENTGDSLVRVFNPIKVETFKAKQIGNGNIEVYNVNAKNVDAGITAGKGHITISGTTTRARLRNVSTGPINAADLQAKSVKCFVFGTGNIDCYPTDNLTVYGAGSGKVFYHFKPEKISNRGIGVRINPSERLENDSISASNNK